MKKHVVLALAIGLTILLGCSSSDAEVPEQTVPDVSFEALVGTWQKDGESSVIQFSEDGTFVAAGNKFVLEDNPAGVGEFLLEDNLLSFTADETRTKSCVGQTGTYEIALTEEGKLHTTLVEDECSSRARGWNDKLWSRISP